MRVTWPSRSKLVRYGAPFGVLTLAAAGAGGMGFALGRDRGAAPLRASAVRNIEATGPDLEAIPEPEATATPPKTAARRETPGAAAAWSPGGSVPPAQGEPTGGDARGTHRGEGAAKPAVPAANVTTGKGPAVRAKGSRGADAIVRWRGAFAEPLGLLEAGRAEEALAWLTEHQPGSAQSVDVESSPRGKGKKEKQEEATREPATEARVLRGRALLALGRFEDARAEFSAPAVAQGEDATGMDAAIGVALCQARSKWEAAPAAALEECLEPSVACWGQALACYEYAQRLEAGRIEPALLDGERVADSAAKGKPEELARHYYQQALLTECLPLPLERACQERLEALTAQLVLNPRRAHLLERPKAVFHKVAAGDSLYKLTKQYSVPIGQLCRLNHLDPKGFLLEGKTLKVLPGPVVVRVDRWRLTATLLIDGVFIKRCPVGLGPDDLTPAGTFTVRKKVVNPDWYYDKRRIPFGDPENILGTRWLGFDPDDGGGRGAGLGLHGTGIPESVPGRESKGCVRMRNRDVEELYDFVPQGGVVEIN